MGILTLDLHFNLIKNATQQSFLIVYIYCNSILYFFYFYVL